MSNTTTRKALDRALARIALAAEDGEGADDKADPKGKDAEGDDQPQGDPTKAQAPPGAPKNADQPPIDEGPKMDPDEEDPDTGDDEDEMFTLEDVIECFLRANSNPTDDQVHALAELLGLDFEAFEALIFQKFGEAVRLSLDRTVSEDDGEDDEDVEPEGDVTDDGDDFDDNDDEDDGELVVDDELDVQDEIDMFVVAYVMFNPQPSDQQIHQLAFVVDLTKEEMEQRIYRMLGSYLQVETDDQDFDAQGVEVDDTEGDDTEGDDDEADGDETDDEEDDPDAGDEDAPDDGADDKATK